MACATLIGGLKSAGAKSRILLAGSNNFLPTKISVASITSKTMRLEPEEKPAPWPYKERNYTGLHTLIDGTTKRLGENSKVIVVEGPPAVGKSNLARALADEFEMKYFPMVTMDHYYITQYGVNIRCMDKKLPPRLRSFDELSFVKNPKTDQTVWLQFTLWHRQLKQYIDALAHLLNTGQGVVLDRCVYTNEVFVETLFNLGYLSKGDCHALKMHKDIVMGDLMKPHLIVYLDVPASQVETNLKNRKRGEEKFWNTEVLEKLEWNYKQNYLKTITTHAELLAYDWSVAGDPEVVVDDIERLDFDKFQIHDPKMEDWRIKHDYDWCEKRWLYTRQGPAFMKKIETCPSLDCPALFISAEDGILVDQMYKKLPGNKYTLGFNEAQGDKSVLFRGRLNNIEEWVDYDLVEKPKP